MLKNISNLGKTLNKAEQLLVNGGKEPGHYVCHTDEDCPSSGSGVMRCLRGVCTIG